MSSKKKPSSETSPDDTRLSRGRTRESAIFPVPPAAAALPESYAATLQEIKTHLRSARIRAILAANPIVIEAYWNTGKIILARQREAAWGAKVIDRLSADLKEAFPDMGGLSSRNLLAMKIFAREFPDGPIAQQPVAQLPWGHVLQIMQRSKDPAARAFYIRETLAHGWSRDILETQIERQLYLRTGQAQNNFPTTQPPDESDLATQIFKDPYLFDFFVAGDAGQINLYRSAVDDLLRHPDDQPTIGLLLCKGKNKLVVEYALSGLEQSIAVADWKTQLTETLPAEFQGVLPTIEEIEAEFAGDLLDEKEEPHTKARSHEEEEEKP